MVECEVNRSSGISALALLGIVFVTLKLCGVITWSWWFVTMPFYIGIVIGLTILIVGFLLAGIVFLFELLIEKVRSNKNE